MNDRKPYSSPMNNKEFLNRAAPLVAEIAGVPLRVDPKAFKTGSVGFHANGPIVIRIDGVDVRFQMNVLLTVIGSKPKTVEAEAA